MTRRHLMRSLKLEQSGGAASPGLGLFFGDFFKVGYVSAGLCKHVVQVIADADKGETFVEEFADASRAEQKQAEDHIIFAGVFDEALCGCVELGRSVHVR